MSGNVNQNEGIILPAEQCAVNRTAGDEKAESSYVRVQAIGKGQYRAIIGAPEIQPDTAEEKRAPTVCAADAKEVSFTSPTGETVSWSFDGAEVIREKDLFPGVDMKAEVSKVAYKETLLFNHSDAVRPITVHLRHEGLSLEREGNACLLANCSGEVVFILPEPFCEDQREDGEPAPVEINIIEGTGETQITYQLPSDRLEGAAYPVILDPTVMTSQTSSPILDAYTSSKQATTIHNGASGTLLRLTKASSSWGQCDCYFRFDTSVLPAITSSDIVISATLVVANAGSTYPNSTFACTLHEVLQSWAPNTLTWNNAPACSPEGRDIGHFTYREGDGTLHSFDITSLVRKWYQGEANYGVKLTCAGNTYAQLRSRAHTVTSLRPYIVIDYVSRSGMDDYLAFDSLDMGRAGTANVNLFNGNLVYTHQDTVCNGLRMPVSMTHAWNACFQDRNWFGLGNGWTCTGNQVLWRETLNSTTYYAWQDGVGTIRYFLLRDGKWQEELGRDWVLTLNSPSSGEAKIEDKNGTQWIFGLPTADTNNTPANVKPLLRITDARGNTASFTTSASSTSIALTAIQDGAARATTVARGSGLMTALRAPGHTDTNDRIAYTYSSSKLTGITYEDGESVSLIYQSGGNLIRRVDGIDGLNLEIVYQEQGAPRVTQISIGTGIGTGRVVLRGKSYAYEDNLTIATDLITGKSIRYHFSNAGQLLAMTDELGYGLFNRYTPGSVIDQPESVSRMQRAVHSLVRDPLLQNNQLVWAKECYNSTGTFAYDTAEANRKFAAKCLKATKTSTGGMLCVSQPTLVNPGDTATFSAWAKTSGNAKAQLLIRYNLPTDSDWHLFQTEEVTSTSEFTQLELIFTVPAHAIAGQIVAMMYTTGGTGTVWWDCAQVIPGHTAGRLNLISNGDFAYYINDWNDAGGSGLDYRTVASDPTAPADIGVQIAHFTGAPDKAVSFIQEVDVGGRAGDCFTAGGWASAHTVPRKDKTERFRGYLAFHNPNGTWMEGGMVLWSEGWSGWHLAAEKIIAPCDYDYVYFSIHYYDNCNDAYFTGLFLFRDEYGNSFRYQDGDIVDMSTMAQAEKRGYDHFEYDEYHNLIKAHRIAEDIDIETTISYGTTTAQKKRRLPLTVTSPLGIVTENTFNTYGGQTEQQITGGTLVMATQTAWDSGAGNYPVTETDARGNSTTRAYDLDRGIVTAVTDPRAQTVNYTYDQRNRVTCVQATVSSKTYTNRYTYQQDRLTQVRHNTVTGDDTKDVVYNFLYDDFGRPTVVKIGDSITLSTTSYNAQGQPDHVLFGNQGKIAWVYDSFGRVTGVKVDNDTTPRYIYYYGNLGEVCQAEDTQLGEVVKSGYDLSNRPRKKVIWRSGQHHYTGEVDYDTCGRLSVFREQVGAGRTAYETTFSYDIEDKPTEVHFGADTRKLTYTYDALGRMSKRKLILPQISAGVDTTYTYLAGANGGTTPLIQKITQKGVTRTYSYDACGNITQVKTGSLYTKYTYDKIGQLTRVNDQTDTTADATGTTWVYTYDVGGNIKTKKAYAYTTGSVSGLTPAESHTYTYGNTNWRDQLTKFDNVTITYDAIGNPTNDGTWQYTWQQGRQLAKMSKTGETVTFLYNADGLRVQKTSTTKGTTKYTLHGKNIVHITNANNSIDMHFYYGANGRPAVVMYNNVAYGYLYNLQGDVVGLVDASGNVVVEYKYDAWGKPLACTGSAAAAVGYWQPFRYRGYVFDEETGLYYLRNRYYNPRIDRFANIDSLTNGDNAFYYCKNNPTNHLDTSGQFPGLIIAAILCVGLGGVILAENYIESRNDLNPLEKNFATNHPIEAIHAQKTAESAGNLTNKYWGKNATNADATYANAFKHALWNALMTRDIGSNMAFKASTAHEYEDYAKYNPYAPWGTDVVTTPADATIMDMINNARGRSVGANLPFWYSDDEVAKAVLDDMRMNLDEYCAIEVHSFSVPVGGW